MLSVGYPRAFAIVGWMVRSGNIELLRLGGARRIRRNEVDLFMITDSSVGPWTCVKLLFSPVVISSGF